MRGGALRATAIAALPVARALNDGFTVEISRVASDGARNACSLLYSALCRAAKGIGYRRAITYTLASETGASLRAAGFQAVAHVKGDTWNRPNRRRVDKHPTCDKVRWERAL